MIRPAKHKIQTKTVRLYKNKLFKKFPKEKRHAVNLWKGTGEDGLWSLKTHKEKSTGQEMTGLLYQQCLYH